MIRAIIFATLLLALPASAQDRIWRVGLLSNGPQTSTLGLPTWRDDILRVLSVNGFKLNHNLELVERYSDGNSDRLPQLAGEMTAARLDVVVAVSGVSVRAALEAIAATPVVMVAGEDPIANGFISGYARPGGRVTGIFYDTDAGDEKRLQLLVEAIPGARRFALLVPAGLGPGRAERLTRTAAALRIDLITHVVEAPDEYSPAFTAMKAAGAVGVLVASKPSEMPVEAPDQWKLTVNLKAAQTLGIAIPGLIMARANEVIE